MNYPILPQSNPQYRFEPQDNKTQLIILFAICVVALLWISFFVVAKHRGWL